MYEQAALTLAQRELDEAHCEWAAAQLLADRGFFRQAIAHSYFAAFRAAQGLLSAHGMETARREGVQRLIGLHFVVAGRLPKEAGRALSALLARRHEADYRLLVDVDESNWQAADAEARIFLGSVDDLIKTAWPQLHMDIDLSQR